MNEHTWALVGFNYGSWMECTCGVTAYTEEEFDSHNEDIGHGTPTN